MSRFIPSTFAIVSLAAILGCSPTEKPAVSQPSVQETIYAHQIFTGAAVYDGLLNKAGIDTVAVRDGIISGIGTRSTLAQMIGPDTKIHALNGGFMYPGFTDAHAHLLGIGMRELILNLEGVESVAQLVEIVGAEIDQMEPGATLYARGWIETGWPEARFPNAADLDPVSPNNPVILTRADGHALVANAQALKVAEINQQTPDPTGGKIEKDANGEPTGILIDAAQGLVQTLVSAPTPERKQLAYVTGAAVFAAYGWTGMHNMSVDPADVNLMNALAEPDNNGTAALPIRVYNSLDPAGLDGLITTGPVTDATGRIITRAIKLYVDGALGSRGAALFEPYTDRPDTSGLLLLTERDAIEIYGKALSAGLQVNTHAIGDRGNRLVLDWYRASIDQLANPPADPRFRIEHAQIVRPDDIDLFKQTGMIASMQPSHAIGDLFFAPDRLGTERLNGAYAWQSMIDAGVIIAGGSDAPVERGDPRIEFYAAVARRATNGFQSDDWHPEQAVSRTDALKMFTLWPAIASFQEDSLGTIEIGKRADFTVFDKDIMTIPQEEILTVETVMTIVDGKIIYQP